MKHFIKLYVIETYSLYLISQVTTDLTFLGGITTLLTAGAYLTLVNYFAKPVINILLLPLNLVTFGIFRWVSSAVALYIVTLLVKNFKVSFFHFSGLESKWFSIPVLHFEGILAFIAFSFILSILISFLFWIFK
jgi:putative membrane protein